MVTKNTENAFLEQYKDLDDEALREIVAGSIPYRTESQFVYAARQAAQQILRERGAKKIPRLPLWDGDAPLPGWIRGITLFLGFAFLTVLLSIVVLTVPERVDGATVCAHTAKTLVSSDWGHRVQLRVVECVTDEKPVETPDALERRVLLRTCVRINAPVLQRWSAKEHMWECRRVQSFLSLQHQFICGDSAPPEMPPGELCTSEWVHAADVVEQPGHPWSVRFIGEGTPYRMRPKLANNSPDR